MASKKQLVPLEIQIIQNLPAVDSEFVGFGAKSDGLYMKTALGIEYKLLTVKDGNLLHSGTTIPSPTLGRIGDYYINNSNWTIYGPKFIIPNELEEVESWGTPTDLKGTVGDNGNMWYTGVTIPDTTQYNEGDFYLKSNGVVYQKVNGIWNQVSNLIGPVGPVGPGGFSDTSLNIGMISKWAGNINSIPEGWLLCDGSTVLKEQLHRIYTIEESIRYGEFPHSRYIHTLSADEPYSPSKQPQIGAIIEYGNRLNPSTATVAYSALTDGYYIIGTLEELPVIPGLGTGVITIRDNRVYPDLVTTLLGPLSYFAKVPDLRGRFTVGYDVGNTDYNLIGATGGYESITLTTDQSGLPKHTHGLTYRRNDINSSSTVGVTKTGASALIDTAYAHGTVNDTYSVEPIGGDTFHTSLFGSTSYYSEPFFGPPIQSHENRPPYYTVAFIIKASYIADMTGKTAYDVYLQSTSDDPVLTKEEWLESLRGTNATLDEDLAAIAALPESTGFLKKTGNIWSIEEGASESSISIEGGVASSVYGGTIEYDFGGAA